MGDQAFGMYVVAVFKTIEVSFEQGFLFFSEWLFGGRVTCFHNR